MRLSLIHYLFFKETCGPAEAPSEKQKTLGLLRLLPLRSFNGRVADIDEKYFSPDLYAELTKTKQIAQLNSLVTGERLCGVLQGESPMTLIHSYYDTMTLTHSFRLWHRSLTEALVL